MVPGSRRRQFGWVMVLGAVFMMFVALTFRVNAVKSEVVRAERQIIALKHETMRLETEFETRANQQQLANWNAVDFGYVAPSADQYLESERQLAGLSQPAAPGAPSPIRVARAPSENAVPSMVSPLTGEPIETVDAPDEPASAAAAAPQQAQADGPTLAERLGMSVDLTPEGTDFGASTKVAE